MIEIWPGGMPKMATVLPEGKSGSACIRHRIIDEHAAGMAGISQMKYGRGSCRIGDVHAMLLVGGTLWMSDTHDEQRDHISALGHARGSVLVGGLGLGMVTLAMALKEEVRQVTVLETNPDVIALVEPYLHAALAGMGLDPGRIRVIQADVLTWKPPKDVLFDAIWMDIWANLCVDDLKAHARLARKFSRKKTAEGWFGCWAHHLLHRYKQAERHSYR